MTFYFSTPPNGICKDCKGLGIVDIDCDCGASGTMDFDCFCDRECWCKYLEEIKKHVDKRGPSIHIIEIKRLTRCIPPEVKRTCKGKGECFEQSLLEYNTYKKNDCDLNCELKNCKQCTK